MVGPNMDCLDPAVYYVDKNVENELVNCTKSLIIVLVVETIAGPFFKNNFVMLKEPNKNYQDNWKK